MIFNLLILKTCRSTISRSLYPFLWFIWRTYSHTIPSSPWMSIMIPVSYLINSRTRKKNRFYFHKKLKEGTLHSLSPSLPPSLPSLPLSLYISPPSLYIFLSLPPSPSISPLPPYILVYISLSLSCASDPWQSWFFQGNNRGKKFGNARKLSENVGNCRQLNRSLFLFCVSHQFGVNESSWYLKVSVPF